MNKKKNNLSKTPSAKSALLGLFCILAFLTVTCAKHVKQTQRDTLNNKIAKLDKEIDATKNFHTATVPAHLRNTQSRYLQEIDSLDKHADTLQNCFMQNEALIMRAFNNYAMRIGRDFQISKILSQNDVNVFQNNIAKLDSMEFVQEMAKQRILHNCGSLHDLSYFFEMFDLDSVNAKLENKLAWNFYTDTVASDDEFYELSVLNFENPELNDILQKEVNLLNLAWKPNAVEKDPNKQDLLIKDTSDSMQYNGIITTSQGDHPNFAIPEFDSVRVQYLRNDSLINAYDDIFQDMLNAEDTLEQYRQHIIQKRDSLVQRRDELTR